MNFCSVTCPFVNKQLDTCEKYSSILARNIEGKLFKCYNCKEAERDASKNKT